jgi:apolipoprotein N-acyltransferase
VIVAVNFFLALAIIKQGIRKMAIISAASLFVINLTLGIGVTLSYKDGGETYKAAAIQGNISSTEKWNGKTANVLNIYKDLTRQAAAEWAEIVVWPETAIPVVLAERPDYYNAITSIARDNDITLIISVFTRDEESGQLRNSILEINSDGVVNESVYSKQRLVPFGEFVPMRDFVAAIFPPLADINMLSSDLSPGEESVVIDGEKGNIGCAVCFDSIYEKVVWEATRNGAELIAVSTNDSWFSDSAALSMHNAQSRLRAIENGRYVIRAANTGISSVIDPMGNVDANLGAKERGYIISDVQMRNDTTLYSLIGNVVVYACIAFVAVSPVIEFICKVKSTPKNHGNC